MTNAETLIDVLLITADKATVWAGVVAIDSTPDSLHLLTRVAHTVILHVWRDGLAALANVEDIRLTLPGDVDCLSSGWLNELDCDRITSIWRQIAARPDSVEWDERMRRR
jgi:hypothetical protein